VSRRRSPVWVVVRQLLFGIKGSSFDCDDARLAAVELEDRRAPGRTAIVHPSTKNAGQWQASVFEDGEPIRDHQAPSCKAALRDFLPSRWRLRNVQSRRR
jgi:hypothetical protein